MIKVIYLNKEYYLRYPKNFKSLQFIDKAILCENKDKTKGFSVNSKDLKLKTKRKKKIKF